MTFIAGLVGPGLAWSSHVAGDACRVPVGETAGPTGTRTSSSTARTF